MKKLFHFIFFLFFIVNAVDVSAEIDLRDFTATDSFIPTFAESGAGGLIFRPSGNHLYMSSDTNPSRIYEFVLNTSFDLTSIQANGSYTFPVSEIFSGGGASTSITDLFFGNDGQKLYMGANGNGAESIKEYNLTVAYGLQTRLNTFNTTADFFSNSIIFRPNGLSMYRVNSTAVRQENLNGAPWQLTQGFTTVTTLNVGFPISDIYMSDDGTQLFIGAQEFILTYELSTPFSLSSASFIRNTSFLGIGNIEDFTFNEDEDRLFFNTAPTIWQFDSEAVSDIPQGNGFINATVTTFNELFPDENNLSLQSKIAFVIIIMMGTAVIICGSYLIYQQNIPTIATYFIGIMWLMEFVYFISIGYIPIAVLIVIVLFLLAVTYFRFRGGST